VEEVIRASPVKYRPILAWLHFEKGCSLRTLQKITDHADIGNLARYLDVDQQEADETLRSAWD
jgi:integrase/recombinase XerD